MSFLSSLLKLGGAVAAPFTGGASLAATAAGGLFDNLGKTAGSAAQGAAGGRQIDTQNILTQDALRNSQYGTQQGAEMNAGQLDLQRKNFTEDARGGRAKQALIASLLGGGFQPTSINVPGVKSATMTGGLAESLKAPGSQQAMQELMRQALDAQLAGGQPGGEVFTGGKVLPPPPLSKLPQAGKLENILGGVGLGSSLLGTILASLKKQSGDTPSNGGDWGGYG